MEGEVWGSGSKRDQAAASARGRKRTAEEDRGAAGAGPRRAEGGAGKKVVGPRAEREAVRVVREESRTQRATRLWVDRDAPWELAVPAKGTERSGVAGSAARVGSPAPAIRLSPTVHFPPTRANPGRNASVAGQPQESGSAVPGGKTGHVA